MYLLSKELRNEFKKPLGDLIKDPSKSVIEKILMEKKPVVCVGDRVTHTLLSFELRIDVAIVDYQTLRKPFFGASIIKNIPAKRIKVTNPAGTISTISEKIIKKIMNECFPKDIPVIIEVEGEEDLLLLPAIINAPREAVLFYGQPGEGLIAVYPDKKLKKKMSNYLVIMEESNGNEDIE